MEEKDAKVCRLCLNIAEVTNFETVETHRTEMIKTILVDLDLSLTADPIICCKCAELLQKCFDFKRTCLSTEDRVKSFIINKSEPTNVNMEDIYFKKFFKSDEMCGKQRICRLCFSLDSGSYANVLDDLEDRPLQDILKNCVPEVNLDLTKEPLVCRACVDLLKKQFTFMLDCLEIEEKIKMYCDIKDHGCNIIDLNKVRQHYEGIKTESCIETKPFCFSNTTYPKLEEVFVKSEPDCGTFKYEELNMPENIGIKDECVKSEPDCETLKYEELNMPENVEIKDECNSDHESCSREEPETSLSQHEEGQSTSAIEEDDFKTIIVNSKKRLSCPKCSYTAKYKSSMKSHMISHKSPSEMVMFRCSFCDYETKRQSSLKPHMLIHKDPSEMKMFKCANCPYQAKRKVDLKHHMYVHNTQPFKCQFCPFESTNLSTLMKRHMLTHKGNGNFECTECPYVTTDKTLFNEHCLVHENPSEITIFRCDLCQFETNREKSLEDHVIIHRDAPEDKMFKCKFCEFKSKKRCNLRDHMFLHNNLSQIVYKCGRCNYSTKTQCYLRRHERIHKDVSEVETFKCNVCDFQSKWKDSLKFHMLRHNPPGATYKCDKCNYSSQTLSYFKKHGRIHKDISEVRFFKCNDCSFQTRWKESLRDHVLAHSKAKMENKKCSF